MKNSRFKKNENNSKNDIDFIQELSKYYKKSIGTDVEKLQNFPKYVPRQDLTNFLAKYELFKKIIDVPGSIVECGVLFGGNLMAFAHFSSIFENVNFERKIIGFDTFTGIKKISKKDKSRNSKILKKGDYSIDSYKDLTQSIRLYDSNRFLNHIPKINIVKGDACLTIPKFIKENPATMVSLLYLDFLVYEPTKIALDNFIPRMSKGSIIAFNTFNDNHYPGTTNAILDTLKINEMQIKRFSFSPYTQYITL